MKTLFIECNMGAAGDMIMAALLELTEDRKGFIDKMNSIGLPDLVLEAVDAEKCGIKGTHINVKYKGEEEHSDDMSLLESSGIHHHEHDHCEEAGHHHHEEHYHHHHVHLSDINGIIDGLDVSEKVKADAKAVYSLIADAEGSVHGESPDQIHFHEVGTMDAVADIVGVCILMEKIGADQVLSSAVHVGSGMVKCAHGILPVPAPATAHLLKGIPTYGGAVEGELCTPTGAALLKYFSESFGNRPVMTTEKIGYGMGGKDFGIANCLRAFLGNTEGKTELITKLECNLDDMTGEYISFAQEMLFEAGARDVYTQAIGMKKSRPGIMLCALCLPEDADRLAEVFMKHTTTLGVRRIDMQRYVLDRSFETADTELGKVSIKRASGLGIEKSKPEFEDIKEIAKKSGMSLAEIREKI